MGPIDVHLVSWNRPKMTELVVKTINQNTKSQNYRLSVFDNGSDDKTVKMLLDLQDMGRIDEIYLSPENIGLEGARQHMLEHMTNSDYFVCVDNDCLPLPILEGVDWVERLLELMQKYEDFAAISCRNPVMIGTGNIFEEADQVGDDIVEFPHPGGSFRMMRTYAVEFVGGWDRKAAGRGSEETYICGKLREAGYRTAFAVRVPCLHLFGTRSKGRETDRWGYDKTMKPEDSGHRDISHPALTNGDDEKEVVLYAGTELAKRYFE